MNLRSALKNENSVAALLSLFTFVLYAFTVCPVVSFIDAGELAAVATTLGIAHPTGYPLFTLLGRLAVMLPIGTEEVFRLNLLSALLTASAVGWMFKSLMLIHRAKLFGGRRSTESNLLPLAAGVLALGFSTTWWTQAVAVEVYSLHLLFLALSLFTFVKGVEEQRGNEQEVSRWLVLFAFIAGLSFTNHLTTMLLAPALLYVYVRTFGLRRESLVRLLTLTPFFVLGISLYLYLPIRASAQPPLNWGNPVDFERFLWHLSGKQYRSWMFTGFESAAKQFNYFLESFTTEFHWLMFLPLLVGIVAVLRRSGRLFLFLLLLFFGCLVYAINYEIHDIDSYFLLAYVTAGLVTALGMQSIGMWLTEQLPTTRKPTVRILVLAFPLVFPTVQWWSNREYVDQSTNFLVHDYTQNILNHVAPNAFILTYQWDYFVAPSYYAQLVKNQRPDVIVIDKELLRRSWYYAMLERRYPQVIERSREKVNRFLAELYRFEHDLPYDAAVIEARFNEMINDFIDRAMEERPVYVGGEIEPQFAYQYQRVPEGLLFRILREGETARAEPRNLVFRPTTFENDYTRGIKLLTARMLTLNAALFQEQKLTNDALRFVQQALSIDSTFRPALTLRAHLLSSGPPTP
jgi:hypothetical protein